MAVGLFEGFRLVLYFSHFPPYLWCLWSDFYIFLVKDIQIKFPNVLINHPWRSDCLLAGFMLLLFSYIHFFFTYFPISLFLILSNTTNTYSYPRYFVLRYLWMMSSLFSVDRYLSK